MNQIKIIPHSYSLKKTGGQGNFRFYIVGVIVLICLSSRGWGVNYDKQIEEYHHKIQTKGHDLREVQQQVSEMQSLRDHYMADEKNLKKSISKTDEQLAGIRKKIKDLTSKLESAKKRHMQLKKEIKSASILKDYWRSHCATGLRNYYTDHLVFDDPEVVNVIRLLFRKALVLQKLHLLVMSERDVTRSLGSVKQLDKDKINIQKKISKKVDEKSDLVELKNEQRKEYQKIQQKKVQSAQELADLEKSAFLLKSLIQKIEDKKKESEHAKRIAGLAKKGMTRAKGNLPWPLTGKVVSSFGKVKHPTLGTYISNNGIEILSTGNADVHAVAKGKVVFAGNFGGFGNMVVIDHRGGFFTVYGKLDEIAVRKNRVVKGYEVLGHVKKKDGVLYFEIRKKDDPEDPIAWLKRK